MRGKNVTEVLNIKNSITGATLRTDEKYKN